MSIRSDRMWRTISCICLFSISSYAIWRYVPDLACPVPDNLLTDEQLKLVRSTDTQLHINRPSCAEFWVNRYQGLIGVVVAAGAAWYAGYWVKKQISRTDAQLRLTQVQIASDRIPSLNDRIKAVHNAYVVMESIEDKFVELAGITKMILSHHALIIDQIEEHKEAATNRIRHVFESNDSLDRVDAIKLLVQDLSSHQKAAKNLIEHLPERDGMDNVDYRLASKIVDYRYVVMRYANSYDELVKICSRFVACLHNNFIEQPSEVDFIIAHNEVIEANDQSRLSIKLETNLEWKRLRAFRDDIVEEADRVFSNSQKNAVKSIF